MEKETYLKAETEIIRFYTEDVIMTSPLDGKDGGNESEQLTP